MTNPGYNTREGHGKDAKPRNLRRYGLFPWILGGLFLLVALVHLAVVLFPAFADGLSDTVGAAVRFSLAKLTAPLFPFSLFECILLLLLPASIFLIVLIWQAAGEQRTERVVRILCIALAVLLWVYGTFVLAFCPGYHGTPLDEKVGLTRQDVTVSDLAATTTWLAKELSAASEEIFYGFDRASIMPYDLDEMCRRLNDAYGRVRESYPFLQDLNAPVKYVAASKVLSYAHITGIYSFFTGEANLNIDFPDYYLPFTAAHEMAHQRGVAREDEANFVAFLVCMASEDAYIRYSGYLEMYLYVSGRLASADRAAYDRIFATLPIGVQGELGAFAAFYEKYENSTLGEISGAVNNTYLQLQGQKEGTKSYGLVADLAVQYYLVHIKA